MKKVSLKSIDNHKIFLDGAEFCTVSKKIADKNNQYQRGLALGLISRLLIGEK